MPNTFYFSCWFGVFTNARCVLNVYGCLPQGRLRYVFRRLQCFHRIDIFTLRGNRTTRSNCWRPIQFELISSFFLLWMWAGLSFDFQVLMTFNKILDIPHEANVLNMGREHLTVFSKKSARWLHILHLSSMRTKFDKMATKFFFKLRLEKECKQW